MHDILIKNGRVIDPTTELDAVCDVLLSDGRIKQLGRNIPALNTEVIDATSCVVCQDS